MSILMTILFLAAPATGEKPLILVEEGLAKATIVVPDKASKTVDASAEELARYLEKISGTKLSIVAESKAPAGPRLDVGRTRNASRLLPHDLFQEDERVVVRSAPGGVTLCGSGDRATRYAVYRLLEHLGCRWLAPGEENEVVPRKTTLAVDSIDLDTKPAFRWRLFNGSRPKCESWGMRMGMNGR